MRAMQELLAAGVSARQAAEAVLSTPAGDVPGLPDTDPGRQGTGSRIGARVSPRRWRGSMMSARTPCSIVCSPTWASRP